MTLITSDLDEFEGILKQQCLDDSGLYEWTRKKFKIHPKKGVLEINDLNEKSPVIQVTLAGAKYAKEWNITSSIASFGFDIIWHSGKIWSFLSDSEVLCRTWVERLNFSISVLAQNVSSIEKSSFNLDSSYQKQQTKQNNNNSELTVIDNSHTVGLSSGASVFNSGNEMSRTTHAPFSSSVSSTESVNIDQSYTTHVESFTNSRDEANRYVSTLSTPAPQQYIDKVNNHPESAGQNTITLPTQIPVVLPHSTKPMPVILCSNANSARDHVRSTTSSSSSSSQNFFGFQTAAANPQTPPVSSVAGISAFSASLLNLDHRHDLQALKDSWQGEREQMEKMHNREVMRLVEAEARAAQRVSVAEAEESQLRDQLARITEKMEILSLEYSRMRVEQSSESASAHRANEGQLESEKHRLHQELTIQLANIEKKNKEDLESLRNQKKQVMQRELDRQREYYETRERETTTDLVNLERLHAGRLAAVERSLDEWRLRAETLEGRDKHWELQFRQITQDHQRQLTLHAQNAMALQDELTKAHTAVQESCSREEQYRAQMSELIEQNRLLRAEGIESQRQAATSQSQAQQLRQVVRESDASESSRGAALQIADDEIRMLEHELKRLSQVNLSLSHDITKYESIIYGSSRRRSVSASSEAALKPITTRPSIRKSMNVVGVNKVPRRIVSNRNVINSRSRSVSPSSSPSSSVARNIFNVTATSIKNNSTGSHTNVSFGRGGGYFNNSNGEMDVAAVQQSEEERQERYQWRDGCLRSPLRCPASSLLLLPADQYEILDLHRTRDSRGSVNSNRRRVSGDDVNRSKHSATLDQQQQLRNNISSYNMSHHGASDSFNQLLNESFPRPSFQYS